MRGGPIFVHWPPRYTEHARIEMCSRGRQRGRAPISEEDVEYVLEHGEYLGFTIRGNWAWGGRVGGRTVRVVVQPYSDPPLVKTVMSP